MRGEALCRGFILAYTGITPAHAGRSPAGRSCCRARRDHPRACGEKISRRYLRSTSRGSPPRMRGEGPNKIGLQRRIRITPAHAGRSYTYKQHAQTPEDHPRACGEKFLCGFCGGACGGSPPRMRGEVPQLIKCFHAHRITPAHAGRSHSPTKPPHGTQDHSRACGEKTKKIPYHRLFPLRSAPFSFSFA